MNHDLYTQARAAFASLNSALVRKSAQDATHQLDVLRAVLVAWKYDHRVRTVRILGEDYEESFDLLVEAKAIGIAEAFVTNAVENLEDLLERTRRRKVPR